jgi:hypothetical protein
MGRRAATSLLLLLLGTAAVRAQINFGGGGRRDPTRPRPSSGSSIEFGSGPVAGSSVAESVSGLKSGEATLAAVLGNRGPSPAVGTRGALGTRRVGAGCTTPQRTRGSCQYIFAGQCRWRRGHRAQGLEG